MERREFLKGTGTVGAAAAGMAALGGNRLFAEVGRRPNLLVFITDQQTFRALGASGNTEISTPNLDRLAQEGAMFRNAYCMVPVCGPSRTSLITGCSAHATKIFKNQDVNAANKSKDCALMTSYDEILADMGYHTEYWGKTHFPDYRASKYRFATLDNHKAYKEFLDTIKDIDRSPCNGQERAVSNSIRKYIPNPFDSNYGKSAPPAKKVRGDDECGKLLLDAEYTAPAFWGKKTIDALERARGGAFAITCSIEPPHAPFIVPDPYYSSIGPSQVSVPENYESEPNNSPYKADKRIAPDATNLPVFIATYYAMISEVDHWIGKVLDKLQAIGQDENTLVIFTSDHGEMLGAHGRLAKFVFYEESVHVPLIMRMPRMIKAGTVIDAPVSLVDIFPTVMDYLQVPDAPVRHGISLRPFIENRNHEDRPIFSEWFSPGVPNYMCRRGQWKFLIGQDSKSDTVDALYDLKQDPLELNNLLGSNPQKKKFLPQAEKMRGDIIEWLEKTGADAETKRAIAKRQIR